MTRRRLGWLRAALAAPAVLGMVCACAPLGAAAPAGPHAQPGTHAASPITAAVSQADRGHEYPSPPVHEQALSGSASAVLAVAAFAVGYINWSARTVSGRMQGLAALSVGQARSLVTLAAAQTAQDYELQRAGVANAGTVEAIAPLAGQPGEYAVVTRERTTATGTDAYRGLAPSWHVALATVIPAAGGGWLVSRWQPEN